MSDGERSEPLLGVVPPHLIQEAEQRYQRANQMMEKLVTNLAADIPMMKVAVGLTDNSCLYDYVQHWITMQHKQYGAKSIGVLDNILCAALTKLARDAHGSSVDMSEFESNVKGDNV